MAGIELWFLYNALLLNVIYVCVKSEVTSIYTLDKSQNFKVTKGNNSKKRWYRVMVHVQCTCP